MQKKRHFVHYFVQNFTDAPGLIVEIAMYRKYQIKNVHYLTTYHFKCRISAGVNGIKLENHYKLFCVMVMQLLFVSMTCTFQLHNCQLRQKKFTRFVAKYIWKHKRHCVQVVLVVRFASISLNNMNKTITTNFVY